MSVGPWQIVIIVLVVLIVFGGKRLPGWGRALGRGVRQLRKLSGGSASRPGDSPDWVAAAAELNRSAKNARRYLSVGRWLR